MQENASHEEYVDEVYFNEGGEPSFIKKAKIFLESRYFFAILIILVAVISFFLGVFWNAKTHKEPLRVYDGGAFNKTINLNKEGISSKVESSQVGETKDSASAVLAPKGGEEVVASKSGTKYHYPWCPGAKQISEKNKISFSSIEEARAKGYTPASNCKGLK